jgi:hypothetical protein
VVVVFSRAIKPTGEEARERALTHATVGWVNIGQGKCIFSVAVIV